MDKYAEPLSRSGVASLGALRRTASDALKALVDPRSGSKVLGIGPLSKLRGALAALDAAEEPFRGATAPPEGATERASVGGPDDSAPPIPGVVFAAKRTVVADECLDRRLFAFPPSHANVLRAINDAPTAARRAVRCFLYDHEQQVLHGIFKPVDLGGRRGDDATDTDVIEPYAWSSYPWSGVSRPNADFVRANAPQTKFTSQLKVEKVHAFPPIHVSKLPTDLIAFNKAGIPAYRLSGDQVREIAKLFVSSR